MVLPSWAWLDHPLTGGRVASLSGICSATIVAPYQIAAFFTCLVNSSIDQIPDKLATRPPVMGRSSHAQLGNTTGRINLASSNTCVEGKLNRQHAEVLHTN